MAVQKVFVDGVEYPLAPLDPPMDNHPAPSNAQYMAITPHIARSWIVYNRHNRTHRRRNSVDLGRDITARAFRVNGESIKISRPLKEGERENVPAGDVLILDGQHRLNAIAEDPTNTGAVVLVTWGLDPDVQDTIDLGSKRTYGDIFKLSGYVQPNVLASVVRLVGAWETGDRRFSKNYTFTTREMRDVLQRHPGILRSVEIACRTQHEFKPVRKSVAGLCHWMFSQVDEGEAVWFFQRLGDGAEMPKEHPVMKLRKRLTDDRGGGMSTPNAKQAVYYMRAWNAYRTDKPEFQLWTRGDEAGGDPPALV